MIIIADSGSTKTHWRILDNDGKIFQENTVGFNPYYISSGDMQKEMQQSFLRNYSGDRHQVYFYGSGCATPESKNSVKKAILSVLSDSEVSVFDDMTGAARSTCNREEGIVGILGTGSNSCYYNGKEIAHKIQSVGYILGDEGSGSYLGKHLLRDFVRGEIPEDLSEKLEKTYSLSKEKIFENVYQKDRPNKYLAGFAPFLLRNKTHNYVYSLLLSCFDDFFENNILKYENATELPFHCVGSVAFYFNEFLRKSASKHSVSVSRIVESPIAGLVLYHKEES